jgi:hypothetical protein
MEFGKIVNRPQQPKKVIMAPSSHEIRFADFFQITLAPSHGVLKFGYFHPQTQEFIVHTQVALTPQGVVGLAEGLKKQLDVVRGKGLPFPDEGSGLQGGMGPVMGDGEDDADKQPE